MSIIEFRAINPATGEVDGDLYDVAPLRDAFERFASGVTLKFIDEDGTKQSEYPYGRRVEVQYTTTGEFDEGAIEYPDGTFLPGFGGSTSGFGGDSPGLVGRQTEAEWATLGAFLTLEPSTTTNDGFPMVEVDGVGYTHLLTRDNPVTDYTDTAKSAILEDLITTFTPVRWDSAKVELVDDSAIDASIRGETPAEIISQIVSQSANEEWFVDRSLTFVVRPQDVESAPAVGDSQIIDHDLPEKGARSINKMTIYYGANEDQAWVEEDRDAQKELQEELDAPRPVEVADSDSFPEITTESEAKAKARKRLGDQSVIQTGTITTPLGFFGTAAGDVFTLSLDDAGIDSEDFRVAQHDYEWSKGTATRTIAENTGGNVDELLVSLSESLTNERLKSADPDAAVTNALRIGTLAEANLSLTVQTKTYGDAFLLGQDSMGVGGPDLGASVSSTATHGTTASRTTVAGLNLMRDVWREGPTAADPWDCLQVGTSGETPTRTDTELNAPVAEFDATVSDTDGFATKTVARIPAGGPVADAGPLQEVGVNCTDLYASLTTDAVDISSDTTAAYRLELTIDNNSAGEGVLTLGGSEEWRDLMLGEGGEATTMVYGDDQTAPDVTDSALGNQTYSDPIDSSGVGGTGLMRWVNRVADTDTDTSILAEVGQENAAGTLLTRSTFEPYGEAVTVETTHEITVRNP